MITKGAIVNGTYALLRISGITKGPSPGELETALQVADDYAAELKELGLDVGWQQPAEYGESDTDDNSGLVIGFAGPIKKLLTEEICSYFGKPIPAAILKTAASGMRALEQAIVTVPNTQNPPTLPFGSGNEWEYRDRKFYSEPPSNEGASYVFKGDIFTHDEDFSGWLVDETLTGAVWETQDNGIIIGAQSETDTVASVELTFNQVGGYTICVTGSKTNSNDTLTIQKNFIIEECLQVGINPFPTP